MRPKRFRGVRRGVLKQQTRSNRKRGAHRSLLGVAAFLSIAFASTIARAEDLAMTVDPGTVVRWVGEDTVMCAAFGKAWAPIGATCYYPIDLLAAEGEVVVERIRKGREERAVVRVGAYPYPTQRLTVDPGMVHLSPENQARHERERKRVAALWELRGPPQFMLPLSAPLKGSSKGRSFGSRRVFNNEPRSPHSGVDYSARPGTPVLAAAVGTVALAENQFLAGNSVFIDHGDGLITMYFHLDRIQVQKGEQVDRGQTIGTVGSTGRATGPHLHFGVRWRGARVDPGLLFVGVEKLVELR